MNKRIAFVLLIMATCHVSLGQLRLTTGDSCTCSFGPTNFSLFPTGPGSFHPVFGEALIRLYETSLPAGTVLRYEMFESGPMERPLCVGLMTETNASVSVAGCDVDNAWADLQGTVRLTMVSGSVTLHSVSLQVGRFFDGQYQRWQGGLPSVAIDGRLNIGKVANHQVQITWPTNAIGFVLERAFILPSAAWSPVTNDVTRVDGQFSVLMTSDDGQALFRLRKL